LIDDDDGWGGLHEKKRFFGVCVCVSFFYGLKVFSFFFSSIQRGHTHTKKKPFLFLSEAWFTQNLTSSLFSSHHR